MLTPFIKMNGAGNDFVIIDARRTPIHLTNAQVQDIAARKWPIPPRILITGSLYLAGEILAANGTPPD